MNSAIGRDETDRGAAAIQIGTDTSAVLSFFTIFRFRKLELGKIAVKSTVYRARFKMSREILGNPEMNAAVGGFDVEPAALP